MSSHNKTGVAGRGTISSGYESCWLDAVKPDQPTAKCVPIWLGAMHIHPKGNPWSIMVDPPERVPWYNRKKKTDTKENRLESKKLLQSA